MPNAPLEASESSWLLLLLASIVMAMTAYVAFQALRRWRISEEALLRWGEMAVAGLVVTAGVVLGTGLSASSVLSLGAVGLDFPLGYSTGWALLLWLGGCLVATLLAALPAWSRRAPVLLGAGTLLGLLAVALQCGWLTAAGFRPGIEWRLDFVGAAALLEAVVFSLAMWMSLSTTFSGHDRSRSWQFGALCLLVLGSAAGQELLIVGAELPVQLGSVYARQIPGTILCVVGGALVPMAYAFLLLRQALRRKDRRRGGRRQLEHLPGSGRKHRRRHRVPTL